MVASLMIGTVAKSASVKLDLLLDCERRGTILVA